MTAHRLKQIALCTMLIDHIGTLLLPEWTFLRMIGRIAFPLFAFLTAESTFHTHRVSHYLARLLVFACISELPFRWSILNGDPAFGLRNVLFTLLLGAVACCCWAKASAQPLWACAAFLPIAAAELLQTDYGAYGAAVVLLFYALRTHPKIVPCAHAVPERKCYSVLDVHDW